MSLTILVFVVGACETAIHFVIYEHIKKLMKRRDRELSALDFVGAAGIAKFTASSLCYPHGQSVPLYMWECSVSLLFFTYRGGQD